MNIKPPFRLGSFNQLAGVLALAFAGFASAENRGVITDPDGFVNVRAGQSAQAAVVAKVKTGEPFTFECKETAEWCKVRTKAGKSGWMHRSRIRVYYTEKDLPKDDPIGESEIDEFARRQGFDYTDAARDAARGDTEALKQFFALADGVDGAAAESHAQYMPMVYHILGDKRFAKFLAAQPIGYRMLVRISLIGYIPLPPATEYLRNHFPETTRTLYRRELVDWPSPDGRYAFRKVFSEEFDLLASKVTQAQLIEKNSGAVLCDVTADDIGRGHEREGEVLWSPDSKMFAYLSSDLTPEGNLFSTPQPPPRRKQTVLYAIADETCKRIDLPLAEVPGRAEDSELEGAFLGHEHTEPLRWIEPNVLLLQRHEYYEKLKPRDIDGMKFESQEAFDRLYEITVKIGADSKASAEWKLRRWDDPEPKEGG